jgi:hypothetical protein
LKKFLFLVTAVILNGGRAVGHIFEREPPKFVLIWFSGFRGEDLNVIFYQNMPNLLLQKIEIFSIVHCCFSISQNELKF